VKGVEFGAGFASAKMRGSQHNDPFYMDSGRVRTKTNNSGGIQGGISNGMPVIFRAAFKPTPSISKAQKSVNLLTGEDVTLSIKGRHDPCVVPRAVPCVIAAAAIVMLDIILGG
jgi:chorismate synthase